jgi:adenylate kinase
MEAMILILMGPPGSGKGTHATPLSRTLSLPHISTGDLFRENIRNQTPLGIEAKKNIDQGKLVPDDLVLDMLFERIARPDCKNGYILDGFPRTIPQAKALDEKLKGQKVIALNFHLEDPLIIERVTGRIGCKGCGRPYHLKFDPPRHSGICDGCGSELLQRDDDREEIIRKRLDVYRIQTEPLIRHYTKQVRHIDSSRSKEQVFQEILEVLPAFV